MKFVNNALVINIAVLKNKRNDKLSPLLFQVFLHNKAKRRDGSSQQRQYTYGTIRKRHFRPPGVDTMVAPKEWKITKFRPENG